MKPMKRVSAFLLSAALLLSPALAAEGDGAYLTCGALTATVEDYTQAVTEVGNALSSACIRREVPFQTYEETKHLLWEGPNVFSGEPTYHWDCTIDGVEFRDYLDQRARLLAFYRPWSESELAPHPTEEEFQTWKEAREADGEYLRFAFLPFEKAETADRARDTLNRDEGQLNRIRTEDSMTPDVPVEYTGAAELYVPEMSQALRSSGGQWVSFSFRQPWMEGEPTIYGVAKSLPLTMGNYTALLLDEAWPGAIDPEDIRLAAGAEELDAPALYEDWCTQTLKETGTLSLVFPDRARISDEAVIAPAGETGKARSTGNTEERFPAINVYPGYGDVKESDWFYDNARLCYEIGIITGTDLGFEPGKTLTGAECAALAARLREGLTGKAIPAPVPDPGRPWYQHYVDYMQEAVQESGPDFYGIVNLENLEAPATRHDFLCYMALVAEGDLDYFSPINSIETLPDAGNDIAALQLYNWGILTGTDKYGTLAPERTLTRAEAAAMVARMARPELRKTFVPADYSPFTAAYLTPDTVMFDTGLTAEEYLTTVNNAISAWEAALGEEFNWHTAWSDGKTVLEHVKEDSLSALGVTERQGTEAYGDFDVQVYYARLIDLTGETL